MRPPLSYVPLLPVAALLIAALLLTRRDTVVAVSGEYDVYEGLVDDVVPTDHGERLTVMLRCGSGERVKALVTVASWSFGFQPGDSVRFRARLAKPEPPVYPDAFDYQRWLRSMGVSLTGYVSQREDVSKTGRDDGLYWRIRRLRDRLSDRLSLSGLSDSAISFLQATLLGDTSVIGPELRAEFNSAGLAHVLALSGTHVAVVAILVTFMLFPLWLTCHRRSLAIAVVAMLWLYAVMTGLSPSVTRAVLMATFLAGGFLIQRPYSSLNSLLAAMIVILIADRDAIYSVGFWMSFASVVSIIVFLPLTVGRIDGLWRHRHRLVYWLLTACCMSVAATLGSGVIAAYVFHRFPLLFLVANLPVLVILPCVLGGGVQLVLLQWAGLGSEWLVSVVDTLYSAIAAIAGFVADVPGSVLSHIWLSDMALAAMLLAVALFYSVLWKPRVIALWLAFGAVSMMAVWLAIDGTGVLPAQEFLLTGDRGGVGAIVRCGDDMMLVCPYDGARGRQMAEDAMSRHALYLDRRGADSLPVVSGDFRLGTIVGNRCLIDVGGKRVCLLTDDNSDCGVEAGVDYAVVTSGYSKRVMPMVERLRPDTLILAPGLHPRRHKSLVDTLTAHGIPYFDMRRRALWIVE